MAPFNNGLPTATVIIPPCIIPTMATNPLLYNLVTYPSLTLLMSSQQCLLTQGHLDFTVSPLLAQEVSFRHKIILMITTFTHQPDPVTTDPTSGVEITTILTLVTTALKMTKTKLNPRSLILISQKKVWLRTAVVPRSQMALKTTIMKHQNVILHGCKMIVMIQNNGSFLKRSVTGALRWIMAEGNSSLFMLVKTQRK